MIRVVYDTNVIVSALLKPGSVPASLVSLALKDSRAPYSIKLCLSPQILQEYKEVLNRPVFGFQPDAIARFLEDIEKASLMVEPTLHLHFSSDEPDNRFLECAVAAHAHYVVTGNTKHFPDEFQGIRIMSPAEFVTILMS